MKYIRIYRYNNYYNRTIKFMTTESEEFSQPIYSTPNKINWDPGDGVITEAIFGNSISSYDGSGDYLVVLEGSNIESKWFIIDHKRIKGGQWQLFLRRDLIGEFYNDIKDKPIFIEKATLPITNPLIYNSENMSYNQILTSQNLLMDETQCPWIVGYLPRNFPASGSATINANIVEAATADYFSDDIPKFIKDNTGLTLPSGGLITDSKRGYPGDNTKITIRVYYKTYAGFRVHTNGSYTFDLKVNSLRNAIYRSSYKSDSIDVNSGLHYTERVDDADLSHAILGFISTLPNAEATIRNNISSDDSLGPFFSQTEFYFLQNLNGKTIYDTVNNTTYKIRINNFHQIDSTSNINSTTMNNLYQTLVNNLNYNLTGYSYNGIFEGPNGTDSFKITTSEPGYSLSLEIAEGNATSTIPPSSNRYHLNDSPYDMFCIPYGNVKLYNQNGTTYIENTSKEAALAIAMALSEDTGLDNSQFDIQLLPYCPARYLISDDNKIKIPSSLIKSEIKNKDNVLLNCIFWCKESMFSFPIDYTINISNNNVEFKVQNECDLYRLNSPNYSGSFDFTATKNMGISGFTVDCQYKPFNPFIHIKPNFNLNSLYGINPEKDVRGLICGGDFSLPQTTNTWAQYELNNKNYQQIFNRSIENLELKNNIQANKDILGGIVGATKGLTSTISNAVTGNIPGAVTAGIGTGADIVGSALTYKWNEQLRNEAIDYRQDLFGYQLGNIQAIPNSIAKTSAINNINKLFPFLEYYTCTDTEKQALRDKLTYNGMTVMAIGTMQQYLDRDKVSYFKGKLIRLDNFSEDYHMVNEIANELDKGVYI